LAGFGRAVGAMTAQRPGCVETALDFGAGDSALGESALEILKLGASGVGDASVHRWRRSDATGAATAQPRGLRRRENPVRVIEVFIDELDLAALGFSGMTPAVTGRPAYRPSTLLKIY